MIEFHADDYGMFPAASRRILSCIEQGCINGISMMPNGPCFEECMEILQKECKKDIALSVHLNLMTEKPLSDPEEIPDLVGPDGNFRLTYGKLLLVSLLPGSRKHYREQIAKELSAQIERCLPYFPQGAGLRLDSHRHFHMIPLVFDAIAGLVEEKNYPLTYIRIIREKSAFYKKIRRAECFRPVNVIKAVLLNMLGAIDRRRHPTLYGLGSADFASILFSGCMTKGNLSWMLTNIRRNPAAFPRDIELMFHPGLVVEEEDLIRISDAEDRRYMSDEMRRLEHEAVMEYQAD